MIKMIMHGCNGAMGRTITDLVSKQTDIAIVAGVDKNNGVPQPYPVYASLEECQEEADVIVDFAAAAAIDHLLDYCGDKKLPVVLCTTGLSEDQIRKVEAASRKTAILRSANMSLGINLLLTLVREAARTLAAADFDIEILE